MLLAMAAMIPIYPVYSRWSSFVTITMFRFSSLYSESIGKPHIPRFGYEAEYSIERTGKFTVQAF